MSTSKRRRLDHVLTERGLVDTRSRARDLILRGAVRIGDETVTKPGMWVSDGDAIEVDTSRQPYVSRGGLKLTRALSHFGFDVRDVVAMDIGASTGGFTDVLLRNGAAHVYAVDVGRAQMHSSLRADPRVTVMEETDARSLTPGAIDRAVGAVVADVSFISLVKVLPAALACVAPGACLIALVKPQFELEPGQIGKAGLVTDDAARAEAVARVTAWLETQPGWRLREVIPSPITGKGGNQEFLLGARFDGSS